MQMILALLCAFWACQSVQGQDIQKKFVKESLELIDTERQRPIP